MSDEAIDPQLSAFASKLQALAPRGPNFNRDRLLFLAGRASAQRRLLTWRVWAVGSTAAAAGLALSICLRTAPEPIQLAVVRWLPAPASEAPSLPESVSSSYSSASALLPVIPKRSEPYSQAELRRRALELSIDALASASPMDSERQDPVIHEEPPTAGSRVWWRPTQP
jgi:hypothetical protein